MKKILQFITICALSQIAFAQSSSVIQDLAAAQYLSNKTGVWVGIGNPDSIRTQTGLNPDVRQAQSEGWSGKGIQIAIVDDFRKPWSHGNNVRDIIAANASGADRGGLIHTWDYYSGVNNFTGKEKVLNFSAGALSLRDPSFTCNASGTSCAYNRPETYMDSTAVDFSIYLWNKAYALPNAVVVKAAGNEHANSQLDVSNIMLDMTVGNRLIIVGALNKDGTPTSKASLTWYSNRAASLSNHFVVANGCRYETCAVNDLNQGTSYAAPRVASYAAIINQKFVGLTPQATAQIILQTARKDTIANYDPFIHGQGEASLSRALSPVGRLK